MAGSQSLELRALLRKFADENKFKNKGKLCVALVVTDRAAERGLPIDPTSLLAESGGQVAGLGVSNVQKILSRNNIDRVLAAEGGRTSRGSILAMKTYVTFLNNLSIKQADIIEIEKFWISEVEVFLNSKPFKLKYDPSKTLRSVIRGVLDQALRRQKEESGTQYVGAVMQHLVGAKLDLLTDGNVSHHSFSTADNQTGRSADFLLGDTSIHVTATPTNALITKCAENIENGFQPTIVTTYKNAVAAEALAEAGGLENRIEIIEIEQFIATNMIERSKFDAKLRRSETTKLIEAYNRIIAGAETDQSLRIEP